MNRKEAIERVAERLYTKPYMTSMPLYTDKPEDYPPVIWWKDLSESAKRPWLTYAEDLLEGIKLEGGNHAKESTPGI